jgi:D-alanyl-lipoteichoic acid acyltransferase DltB (MBOAT superfamily)
MHPWVHADWTDWRGFWLNKVLPGRFLVLYALPLVLILRMLPQRHLKAGIVLGGWAFVAYVFGVFYLLIWVVICLAVYRFSEFFARECRRTDVVQFGPPLAAWLGVAGGLAATVFLARIEIPAATRQALLGAAPWLFPMGIRGWAWEPDLTKLFEVKQGVPRLFSLLFWAHFIGTAYLAARMLHYFSEIKRGTIPAQRRTLLNFLSFVSYAPTLMQGPIERFDRFQEQIDTCRQRRTAQEAASGLGRIAIGFLRLFIARFYFDPVVRAYLQYPNNLYYKHPEQIESYAFLYFGVFIHVFWLFLLFAGYCDVVIGMSRFLGYRVVENFRWPWFAPSMTEIWRRWHISLSFILRDYVFTPLIRRRWPPPAALCLTFFAVGVWHGPLVRLGMWGVVMGLMVAVNHTWVRWMRRIDRRPGTRLHRIRHAWLRLQPLPTVCAWLITMHAFVSTGLLFFGTRRSWRVLWEIVRRPTEALFGTGP